jgi:hypothetical protein
MGPAREHQPLERIGVGDGCHTRAIGSHFGSRRLKMCSQFGDLLDHYTDHVTMLWLVYVTTSRTSVWGQVNLAISTVHNVVAFVYMFIYGHCLSLVLDPSTSGVPSRFWLLAWPLLTQRPTVRDPRLCRLQALGEGQRRHARDRGQQLLEPRLAVVLR